MFKRKKSRGIDQDLHGEGKVNTDETCTNCNKLFRATIDFSRNGNHIIVCPNCGHRHCRVIKNGTMTSTRWSSRNGEDIEVPTERIWSDESLQVQTSSAAEYMRQKWLDK